MEYIVTRSQLTSFLKRRFSIDELNDLVLLVKHRIEDEGIMEEMVIYDEIRNFLASKKNDDINDNDLISPIKVYMKKLKRNLEKSTGIDSSNKKQQVDNVDSK